MQKFTTQVKEYTCTKTILDNGQETFHCTCQAWHQAKASGVPCKHICALLFTQGNTDKWEALRSKLAKEYDLKPLQAQEALAKGLRTNNLVIVQWFKNASL